MAVICPDSMTPPRWPSQNRSYLTLAIINLMQVVSLALSMKAAMARVVQLPSPIYVYTAVLRRACLSDSINLYAPEPGNGPPKSSPPVQSVPPQVSPRHKVFVGSDGLRAGWSLLIFVLIAGFLLRAVGFIANKMQTAGEIKAPFVLLLSVDLAPPRTA